MFPEECLAITFTRRAAEEVGERLRGLLGPVAEDVTVSTFHALCLSILREHHDRPAWRRLPVADDADRIAAIVEAGARDGVATMSAAQARRPLARSRTTDCASGTWPRCAHDLVDVDDS